MSDVVCIRVIFVLFFSIYCRSCRRIQQLRDYWLCSVLIFGVVVLLISSVLCFYGVGLRHSTLNVILGISVICG